MILPGSPRFDRQPPRCAQRCFATTADGRIPLRRDWPRLLQALPVRQEIALQTRHAHARLIRLAPLPAATIDGGIRTPRTFLAVNAAHVAEAAGRLQPCACCASPGRIELYNTQGSEFLQLCGSADQSPADWAATLAPLAAGAPDDLRADPDAQHHHVLPGAAAAEARFDRNPAKFTELCHAWTNAGLALTATLKTAAAVHRECFVPTIARAAGNLLMLHGGGRTLQLCLPAIAELRATAIGLQAVNADGGCLLTLAPGSDSDSTTCFWHEITQTVLRT